MAIRVGFLGAGLIANYHRNMLQSAGADVVWAGVHDPVRERADAFASQTGAPVLDTEDAVLDRCDAVYVCTWTSEHPRLVDAACGRRLAVFCEKPLAVDLAGARFIADAASGAGVVCQVGLVLRFSPAMTLLRSLVDDPAGGRLMAITLRDDQYIPIQGMYGSSWRGDRARAGAGTLLEHSIHDVDLLEQFAGRATAVGARTANFHGLEGIEDTVVGTLSFASGAVGTLVSVWHDLLERPSLRRIEIFREHMWCALEGDWYGPVRWMRSGEDERVLEGDGVLRYLADAGLTPPNPDAEFIRCVTTGVQARPDFADAVRAHELVDALYRSAASGATSVAV